MDGIADGDHRADTAQKWAFQMRFGERLKLMTGTDVTDGQGGRCERGDVVVAGCVSMQDLHLLAA